MSSTTIKERLNAAREKTYYHGVANKILSNMNELRSSADKSPNTVRRWVWELLQNANDAAGDVPVNIEIGFKEKKESRFLSFKHDGLPFTTENIRNLIEQTSTKDRKKTLTGRRKKVGKFGTGFITTHLLSEIVNVRGVLHDEGTPFWEFRLRLDRSGDEPEELMESVEAALLSIEELDDSEPFTDYNPENYNTHFLYELGDSESLDIALKGIEDLKTSLPYALCFVEGISSVTLTEEGLAYLKSEDEDEQADGVKNVVINVFTLQTEEKVASYHFKVLTKDFTSVMLPVSQNGVKVSIAAIPNTVPRIFCDFPLIGTESFPFPAIINNPNFNSTDPRDAIYLSDSAKDKLAPENKTYVEQAVGLFKLMLAHAIKEKWDNLHELAKLDTLRGAMLTHTSEPWHTAMVREPLTKMLLKSAIVKNSNGTLHSILMENGEQYMWFPSAPTKELRKKLYDVCNYLIPDRLPHIDQLEFWSHLSWSDVHKLNFSKCASVIVNFKQLKKLQEKLINIDAISWLNMVYELFALDEKEFAAIMDSSAIVPDQKGNFWIRGSLSQQDDKIESTFLDILEKFGIPIRERLAADQIKLDFAGRTYSQNNAVAEIISEFGQKTNDREVAQKYQPALSLLLLYIKGNDTDANRLFPSIVRQKHLLYDDEVILDNISKAEKLQDLLSDYDATSVEDLRKKIEQMRAGSRPLLPVTEHIIASMGISSKEEWEKAMEDVDFKALFAHQSVASTEMFILASGYIKQARERVIAHLRTLTAEYDLADIDNSTTGGTVLSGIRKNGNRIMIVFRPAYNKEVILYYDAERDTLDYEDAELWIDDGDAVRQITLGEIIKKNAITKFSI